MIKNAESLGALHTHTHTHKWIHLHNNQVLTKEFTLVLGIQKAIARQFGTNIIEYNLQIEYVQNYILFLMYKKINRKEKIKLE